MPDHHGRSAGACSPSGSDTARSGHEKSARGPLARFALSAILLILPRTAFAQPEVASLRSLEEMQWGVRAFHSAAFNNAILSLERAISLDTTNLLARQWLGRALYRNGLEEEALAEWRFVAAKGGGGAALEALIGTVASRRSLQRVLAPHESYSLVSSIEATDRRDPRLGKPTAVRARSDGTFYVVSYTSTQIQRLDSNFSVVGIVRGGLQGFNRPFDIVESDEGQLFVSEYGANQVTRCSPSGERLATIGGSGVAPGRLLGPQYLATDSRGYLYVSEYGNRRVSKFDTEGNFVLTIGTRGPGFPGLEEPTGIAVQDDRLYVADRSRGVLQVFDLTGNYMGAVGSLREPEGVHAAGGGRLLVAQKGSIVVLDVRAQTVEPLADPFPRVGRILGLSIDVNSDVLAADFDEAKVLYFAKSQTLYSGLFVQVERVSADRFPQVVVDVSVSERSGRPVLGLTRENFVVSERLRPVADLQLAVPASAARPLYVMLLAEKSQQMRSRGPQLARAVEELYAGLEGSGSLGLAAASRQASLPIAADGRRLALREAAVADDYSDDWRFDQGVRLAASQLAGSRARRALVFLSTGSLGPSPYAQYSLMELAQYLRNNDVSFHVLQIGPEPVHPDLAFLAGRTGGSTTWADAPRRVRPVVDAVKAWVPPTYTLRFASSADADFGRAYIELQVDVTQQRRSGRDESGYYAPRQY